ncbi:hypothetical protein EMPS_05934 [Entomortierella parvispora]|uniref:Fucosyltransferase n=1 Tax=Entomortierella parvispora TaxID=205924 RepID=A0A9P3HBK4_9FUNG|nr:hypothetical protein EMPS_05934 [Entomortierella parvispora]
MPATPAKGNKNKKVLTSKKMPEYTILWWTRPPASAVPETVERPDAPLFDPVLPFSIGDCGLPYTCSFTNDRAIMSNKGSVVLFRGSHLEPNDLPPLTPTKGGGAKDNHAWVLNTVLESPGAMDGLKDTTMPLFTHSWSHSFDSDIVQTTFDSQGSRQPSQPTDKTSDNNPSKEDVEENSFLTSILTPPKVDIHEKNRLRFLSRDLGGKAPVAWILGPNEERGTLGAESRENYVRELMKVIDVDIYGATPMNNTVWPGTPSADNSTVVPVSAQEIMANYKFVLALEPVHCQDFVSTTLADALLVGTVPIVDGPKDYSRFSPTVIQSRDTVPATTDASNNNSTTTTNVKTSKRATESLILLDDFLAPELLAQELLMLDDKDSQYLKRLAYRDPSKNLISLLFKESFGGVDSAVVDSSTTKSAATTATLTPTAQKIVSWTPDQQGALCKICEMAQQLAENTYDWTSLARARKVGEKGVKKAAADTRWISAQDLLQTLTVTGTGEACSAEPKYLPGLPVQMKAYDAFLQKQHEQNPTPPQLQVNQQQQQQKPSSEPSSEPSPNKDPADPAPAKITSHSVDVTVSFDSTKAPTTSPETPPDQDPNLPNTWIQPGELSGNLPSVIIHHQEHVQELSPESSPAPSSLLPSLSADQNKTLFEQSSLSEGGASPPPFEMYYLLLLILALGTGALALVLITSKRARTLALWPWRHLFYNKVATVDQEDPYPRDRLLQRNRERRQNDRTQATQSLERIMLQELGEDLLYE